jgi:hypothetical protein
MDVIEPVLIWCVSPDIGFLVTLFTAASGNRLEVMEEAQNCIKQFHQMSL